MKKIKYLIIPGLFFGALPAKAICPVCIVAVGAGLGLSEYLGIDDTIAGLWIGGLLMALNTWTIDWFNNKKWLASPKNRQYLRNIFIFILYYGLTIWPLYSQGFIGQNANRLWGLDKLILGLVLGSLLFRGAVSWYDYLKKKNNDRAHFPYQKVVMPVGALLLTSFIFYLITR